MPAPVDIATPDARGCTVLIAVEQGFGARFFLRTEVLDTLLAAGARVVVLTPNHDEGYLREELADERVTVEPLRARREVVQRSRPWWLVHNLRTFALAHPRRSPAFLDYYQGFREQGARDHPAVARAIHLALRPLWRSRALRRALAWLEARLFTPALHGDVFDRWRPDLVVASSPGWFLPDALVLREARRRGLPTAAVVLAWDNPTNKGYRGADPDRTVVWSQRMADQLALHHDYPADRIEVGGVPHFDPYLRADELPVSRRAVRTAGAGSGPRADPVRRPLTGLLPAQCGGGAGAGARGERGPPGSACAAGGSPAPGLLPARLPAGHRRVPRAGAQRTSTCTWTCPPSCRSSCAATCHRRSPAAWAR